MFDYQSPVEMLVGEMTTRIENACNATIQQKLGFKKKNWLRLYSTTEINMKKAIRTVKLKILSTTKHLKWLLIILTILFTVAMKSIVA